MDRVLKPAPSTNDPVTPSRDSFANATSPSLLEQLHVDEFGAEMDSEDDDCSDSSSVCSDGSSTFDTSSIWSLVNESDSLNERRRAMLDLSISKIQTMNASNVAVSLRKSLLIYNTMKSLQRDLDACGVYVCGSLTERGNGVAANDMEMLEDEAEEGDWEQRGSDLDNNNDIHSFCNQRLGYCWSWDSAEFAVNGSDDTIQGLEKCDAMFTLAGRGGSENIWSGPNGSDSSTFIEDYLGMWGAWEDENYNPLTNCNLTQAEIKNMFRLPVYHHNNQLVSQA